MRASRSPLQLDKPLVLREWDTCAAPCEAELANVPRTPYTLSPTSCPPTLPSTVSRRRESWAKQALSARVAGVIHDRGADVGSRDAARGRGARRPDSTPASSRDDSVVGGGQGDEHGSGEGECAYEADSAPTRSAKAHGAKRGMSSSVRLCWLETGARWGAKTRRSASAQRMRRRGAR